MTDEKFLEFMTGLAIALEAINGLKADAEHFDPRALAVAATQFETALLWIANARK